MKRILSLLLCATMLLAMVAGCSTQEGTESPAGTDGSTPAASGDGTASYTIATNNFGVGAYPLDMMVANEQSAIDAAGMTLTVTNNEFTADKVISQLQNQLAANPDGVAFLGISETLFPVAAQYCKNAETPYVFYACSPTDEDMAKISEDELYVGMVIYSPTAEGSRLAELALADGCKTAVISAGASGDYAHDRRVIGFTETFEAGGGEVLFVSHSADPSEGVQKTNDFMTAYADTDCIYATGEDYITPAADVIKSRGLTDCKIYGSNISPNVCQLIMDGQVEACTGGEFVCGGLAVTLLINYLDGNAIKDPDGKAPYFDNLSQFIVTPDNAEAFYQFLSDEELSTHTISDEEYQNLLVRNNPDVDYDYYVDFLAGYEENVYAKVEANAQ